jgi:hypothetical protein
MARTSSGLRLTLLRLAAVLISVVVSLLLAEGGVRLFPRLLNEKLQHAAFSKYDTLPGGIFQFEGITRARFMRADYTTRAFSHGLFWSHRTDENGFRNPPGFSDRKVLLLGDSLIYGHGVDGEETVGAFLRSRHGVQAYDLSAQGQCLYENYLALRLLLDEFRPETVLLFVFVNDIRDVEQRRRGQSLSAIPEISDFDYSLIRQRLTDLRRFHEPWPVRAAFASSIVRMVAKTRGYHPPKPPESSTPEQWRKVAAIADHDRPTNNNVPDVVLDDSKFEPVERYYDALLGDLASRCRQTGARLVLVHLVPPTAKPWRQRERAQNKLQASLQEICNRNQLELYNTTDFFQGKIEWILPGDGHFNPAGNRALADFLEANVLDVD